ncbi:MULTISPECIES: DUF2141 domain-containing protein [unclassified Sphingomonas]|uniref:DUF2141 domain-containing protein n=1 Tax=unclassified Sphingomonas TaxID=196159 RepID=UPI00269AC668
MNCLKWLAIVGVTMGCVGPTAGAAARPELPGSVTLQIEVTGVRNAKGVVHVDICRQAEFLKTCPVRTNVLAVAGKTVVTFADLAPGAYAAQVTHDENNNGKVDRALFGIPKEGVGFSNDAPIRFGPPKWKDAMFQLAGDKAITLKMRYFSGSGARN